LSTVYSILGDRCEQLQELDAKGHVGFGGKNGGVQLYVGNKESQTLQQTQQVVCAQFEDVLMRLNADE
jgi:hypothetical protein